ALPAPLAGRAARVWGEPLGQLRVSAACVHHECRGEFLDGLGFAIARPAAQPDAVHRFPIGAGDEPSDLLALGEPDVGPRRDMSANRPLEQLAAARYEL